MSIIFDESLMEDCRRLILKSLMKSASTLKHQDKIVYVFCDYSWFLSTDFFLIRKVWSCFSFWLIFIHNKLSGISRIRIWTRKIMFVFFTSWKDIPSFKPVDIIPSITNPTLNKIEIQLLSLSLAVLCTKHTWHHAPTHTYIYVACNTGDQTQNQCMLGKIFTKRLIRNPLLLGILKTAFMKFPQASAELTL